jgi:adenine-specific DNA-methyltransferase
LNELEFIEAEKPYTTLSFLENEFSNDNAKKELDRVFVNGEDLFKNPKPSVLIEDIVKMVCSNPDAIILDFFAGSGTTGHAVLDLNKDEGNRTFILCQLNETTPTTPNGIAYDVTAKRLKRIMTGECYDGTKDFKWIKENQPYGGNLDVYDLATVANFADTDGKTPFEVIDETLYGQEKFQTLREKVEWVCGNFSNAQKNVENDDEWKKRIAEG